jgi:hypothetical protein
MLPGVQHSPKLLLVLPPELLLRWLLPSMLAPPELLLRLPLPQLRPKLGTSELPPPPPPPLLLLLLSLLLQEGSRRSMLRSSSCCSPLGRRVRSSGSGQGGEENGSALMNSLQPHRSTLSMCYPLTAIAQACMWEVFHKTTEENTAVQGHRPTYMQPAILADSQGKV